MSEIRIAPTSTNEFKTASALQSKRHSKASVTAGQEGVNDNNEARYWTQKLGLGSSNSHFATSQRKFAHPRSVTLPPVRAFVVHQLLFGPTTHNSKQPPLAVVSGPRVSLYGSSPNSAFHRALARHSAAPATPDLFGTIAHTVDADRHVQTGGNLALCGSFRNDGRLLAVGTDAGEVRVCDVTMRATISTFFVPQKLAVRAVEWFRNGQHVLAGGDDGVARIWDLSASMESSSKALLELKGHGDVIRCAALWQNTSPPSATNKEREIQWSRLAMTGSYDHTIRVWNVQDVDQTLEEDRCLAVLSHEAPVEALCLLASEDPQVPVWLLSAGGTSIKVWNPATGKCFATIKTQHRKTITSLLPVARSNLEEDQDSSKLKKTLSWRVLTASLDGLIQFHSWDAVTGNMEHLYSTKVGDSITSVACDKSGERFAVGTVNGEVVVRMKGPSIALKKRRRDPIAGTYAFFQRGMNAGPAEGDYTVTTQGKKRKMRSFDVALKQFRYGDALDDALATRRPRDVVAVLEELGKRRGLTIALANRDEELLEPILSFTIRYIIKPHFTSLLIGVAHKLIDIYSDVAGQSETIDELFAKLKRQVANESRAQTSLLRLVGQIDAIMTSVEME